jgi:hypothetical protein
MTTSHVIDCKQHEMLVRVPKAASLSFASAREAHLAPSRQCVRSCVCEESVLAWQILMLRDALQPTAYLSRKQSSV